MRWLERQIESECMNNRELDKRVYMYGVIAISIKAMLDFSELFSFVPKIVNNSFAVLFLLCMFYKILHQRYTKKMLLLSVLLGITCIYTYLFRNSYFYMITTFLCIIAMQDVSLEKLLKKTSILNILFLSSHVICYWILYLIMPWKIHFYYRSGSGAPRHSFLVGHANSFGMYITWTSLQLIYAYYDIISIPIIILIYIINVFFYMFTDSNSGIIILTITMVAIICSKLGFSFIKKLYSVIAKWGFLFCTLFFAGITIVYSKMEGPLLAGCRFLDKLFTGRLSYGAVAYDLYGCTFLGKELNFPAKLYWKGMWFDGMVFDNMYIMFFVKCGFFYMLLIGILFVKIGNKLSEIEKMMLVAYLFYSMTEAYSTNAIFCFPLLFIGKYIFTNHDISKKRVLPEVIKSRVG